MGSKLPKMCNILITAVLVFQLTGCGTLFYPERKGQIGGRLDTGVVILDAVGLLFFLIPGIIAFAVDFGNGCIYLPAHRVVVSQSDLRQIRFDPKKTSLAQLERIIKDQTGYTVRLTQNDVRVSRLKSTQEMMVQFAKVDNQDNQLALNR